MNTVRLHLILDLRSQGLIRLFRKEEYLIDKRLSIDYKPEIEVVTSLSDGHSHTVKIPITEGIERIKAGDRVLVCWIDVDPIVVAVIVSSSDIGKES